MSSRVYCGPQEYTVISWDWGYSLFPRPRPRPSGQLQSKSQLLDNSTVLWPPKQRSFSSVFTLKALRTFDFFRKNIAPCLQFVRVQRARERIGWTITMYLNSGDTERREEQRCKSIFSNKTRIYFDSLIIAILNIGNKNILINKLG